MVFKQNKLSSDYDDSVTSQLAFHEVRQVDCGNQFPFSACRHAPGKQPCSDGGKHGNNWEPDNSNCETVKADKAKRLFSDEEKLIASAKRTKQLDGNVLISRNTYDEFKCRQDTVFEKYTESHDESFSFQRFTRSTSVGYDACLESPVRLSFFPGHYEDCHRPVIYNSRAEESQSSIFNYFSRKPVAIGPNHQADIPSLRPKPFQDCYKSTENSSTELTDSSCNPNCQCLDKCSIDCVRRHVMEARENLRSSLGHMRFVELGFCEMGESIALKWTEEEENLFHEVVISNPASLGRDFWNELSYAFPSRSSKELVSYYFNVYMLRKRAEQNHFDPSNIDSDNDEWQLEDQEDDDDYDDSGVESPPDDTAGTHKDVIDNYGTSAIDDCDDHDNFGKSKFGSINVDQDAHDDSCTSYEDHPKLHYSDMDHGLSCINGHDFFVDHCDKKPWEMMSYISSLDKEPELLPTCNVIEEVFGNGSWDKK